MAAYRQHITRIIKRLTTAQGLTPRNGSTSSRGVATWSPLGSAFNTKASRKLETSGKNVGLFGMPELTRPEGFFEAQEKSLAEVNDLLQQVIHSQPCPEIVVIFDKLSDALCRVADLSDFVRIAHPDENFRKAAESACMAVSATVEVLNTNVELHRSLRRLLDSTAVMSSMDKETQRVAQLFMFDFEQSGIHLEESKRKQFVALNEELLTLGSHFLHNTQVGHSVAKSKLPQHLHYCFTVDGDNVTINSLNSDSPNDFVREAAYKIYLHPNRDQSQILDHLLSGRHRLANLVGFPTWAHRALRGTMAGSPENVMAFLSSTSQKLFDRVEAELSELRKVKARCNPTSSEIFAWDPPFYMGATRSERFAISPSDYTPYLSLGACMEGLQVIVGRLYDIELENLPPEHGEVWAPDVLKLAVKHKEEGLLGYIYCDFFDRPGKPHQDCHFTIRGGRLLDDGTYQLPRIVLACSLPSSRPGSLPLLTHGMMENLFHEFGHALHSMLGRTRYQHVTGTRCSTDFAEVPSILMEYFANDYRVLREFARHHQTNETLPEEMITRLCQSKKFGSAYEMQTQVFYSILDQVFHGDHPLGKPTIDILADIQRQHSSIPYVQGSAWHLRFGHLVGYGAKYYSYLYSRAVASQVWHRCFAEDPLSRTTGERYRREMLSHGGGKEPSLLVQNMIGKHLTSSELVDALINETNL
ncbi:mitochondrial intermediate peptidase-like [Diadema antillarum]|uniref:mitochondrial intermediate peptidase-like n=1 Tax=Diadema antillarum TaxID=105358 RepID=UPI003A876062